MSEGKKSPTSLPTGLEATGFGGPETFQRDEAPQEESHQKEGPKAGEAETYESFLKALPAPLRKRWTEKMKNPAQPLEGLTDGQKEMLTYLELLYIKEHGLLTVPKDEQTQRVFEPVFDPPLSIKKTDGKLTIIRIVDVQDGNFICVVTSQSEEQKVVEVSANKVLEAQRQIVEESSETGIIKASSLRKFLESQKYLPPADASQLSENQQKFNQQIEQYIQALEGHPIASPQIFSEAMTLVLTEQSQTKIQEKINEIQTEIDQPNLSEEDKKKLQESLVLLQQMGQLSEKQIKTQAETLLENINNGQLTPQQIDVINNLLENDQINFNNLLENLNNLLENNQINSKSLQKLLEVKEGDSEETKNEKTKAQKVAEWMKRDAPIIGGALVIFLLFMILQSAKQGGGGGGMMG